jgi:hypothetical protein
VGPWQLAHLEQSSHKSPRGPVFCNRNATGAPARVSGTSSRVTEPLAARIMSFNGGGLLDFL